MSETETVIQIFPTVFLVIFILVLSISIYLIWITRKRKYSVFDKFSIYKWTIYLLLICLILLLFIFSILEVFFVLGVSYATGMLWTLLTSLVMGMMLLCIGLISSKSSKYMNYIIIIVVLCLSLSGMGYVGIRFSINIPLFIWTTYQSNGIYGIWFYSLNSHIWIIVIFISTIFEREKE